MYAIPPLVQQANRLFFDIEQAIDHFARRHKYGFGAKLGAAAFTVALLARRAWAEKESRSTLLHELEIATQGLKLHLQLGKEMKAFASFRQFECLARQADELGRQLGGWKKASHPNGQNAAKPQRRAAARPDTEYSRRLPAEANA